MSSNLLQRIKKLEDNAGIKPLIFLLQGPNESLERAIERFNNIKENKKCQKLTVGEVRQWTNGIWGDTGMRFYYGNGCGFAHLLINTKREMEGEPLEYEIFTN